MRSLLSGLKWTISNLVVHWRNRHQRRRLPRDPSRTIFFDVKDNLYERYLLLLVLFFDRQGYTIILRAWPSFVCTWNTSLILRFVPRARLSFKNDHRALVRISDRLAPVGKAGRRILRLGHDYFAPPDPEIYRVPMPMVNSVYVQDLEAMPKMDAGHMLENMRPVKLFFAGDFGGTAYAPVDVRQVFGMMDRPAMLQVIRGRFRDLLFEPKRWEDLARVDRPLCIVDRYNDFNVPPRELRWILSHADFTVAFPGVVMPWTHGVIEAMSLGVVPIIQYPHLFDPPLRDGVECLAFKDEESLVAAVSRALALDAATVTAMKENVRHYYGKHLSPAAVVDQIMNGPGLKGIRLMAEHRSVDLLKARLAIDPRAVVH